MVYQFLIQEIFELFFINQQWALAGFHHQKNIMENRLAGGRNTHEYLCQWASSTEENGDHITLLILHGRDVQSFESRSMPLAEFFLKISDVSLRLYTLVINVLKTTV